MPDGGREFFPEELPVPFPLEADSGRWSDDELGLDACKRMYNTDMTRNSYEGLYQYSDPVEIKYMLKIQPVEKHSSTTCVKLNVITCNLLQ